MNITKTLYVKTSKQWRNWLEKHHQTEKEIWLIKYKKPTGVASVSYQDSVDQALCFGWIDGIEKSINDQKFAQRFTPRKKSSHWTKNNISRFKYLQKSGLVSKYGLKIFHSTALNKGLVSD